jgi:hypothetical protein
MRAISVSKRGDFAKFPNGAKSYFFGGVFRVDQPELAALSKNMRFVGTYFAIFPLAAAGTNT